MNQFCLLTAALCLGSTLLSTPVLAQAGAPVSRPNRQQQQTLADFSGEISWDPATRGPLILVAPEKAKTANNPQGRPATPPERGPGGYSVNALAPYFDFRLIPCGTVSSFAPATMRVLATRLPKPEIESNLMRGDRLALLQGTFTEAQWRQIGSDQGLGANDLTGKQREMFLDLLPSPLVVNRITTNAEGKTSSQPVTLSPEQRASVRISLRKRVTWAFPSGPDGSGSASGSVGGPRPNSETMEVAATGPVGLMFDRSGRIFGAALMEEQRARLKPGDLTLDWNGLDPVVTLTGAKTVGELVERIRKATRVEIYCDRRYGELPVVLWGDSARSGDVLTALCYGVTGTFRKVGPAFILTDNREGLGYRMLQIQEWVEIAKGEMAALRATITAGLARRPANITQLDASDPTASDSRLAGKIADFENKYGTLSHRPQNKPADHELLVPVAELPPDARYMAEGLAKHFQESSFNVDPQIRTNVVRIQTYEAAVLVIPGVGAVHMAELTKRMGDDEPTLPAPPEPKMVEVVTADRALIIAPRDAAEAVAAVADAKRRGFQHLWVAIRPEDIAIVEAAVKAGKTAGIPVGAVIRVLRAGADTTLPRDRNVSGEDSAAYAARAAATPAILFAGLAFHLPAEPNLTAGIARRRLESEKRWGAWLQCDAPEVQAAALRHVTAIAKVPDLAGLILRDLHAPGYEPPTPRYLIQTRLPDTLGYNEAARLTFLQQYGVDPIDLGPGDQIQTRFDFRRITLTYMPDYGLTGRYTGGSTTYGGVNTFDMGAKDAAEKWLEFRVTVGNRFAESFVRSLRAAAPGVALWLYPQTPDLPFVTPRWLTRLDDGDAGIRLAAPAPETIQPWPPTEGGAIVPGPATMYQVALKGATVVSFSLWGTYTHDQTARQHFLTIAEGWSSMAKEGWPSVTLDLSDETIDAVPGFLDPIKFVTPTPGK